MADLTGQWRAAPAEADLDRTFAEPGFDDGGWEEIAVPGHWRSNPAFAGCDGPLLYRHHFSNPQVPAALEGTQRRWWLVADGIFYESDVWLDGAYLGDTEGYFFPHCFEITDAVESASEHVLALEVACHPQTDRTSKRNITGVFQHWDCIDPEWNPGGIWRPVRVHCSGPVRIRYSRALCQDATEAAATLFLRAVLDTPDARTADLVVTVLGSRGEQTFTESRSLAAGENRVEWRVTVAEPELWWPRALGPQPLSEIQLAVRLEDGSVSDARSWQTGFRSLRLRNWIFEVNGERLFVKGSNHGPTRMQLAEATPEEVRGDVDLALDANLDMLRVHAHVARPELYEAADRAGLLLCQDFPLQWGYSRSIRRQARRQAREMVDLLAHHPSVVLWCGHNEPLALEIDPDAIADPRKTRRIAARGAAAMMLPTWNKTVLDHTIRRVFERNDPSRPVVPHSGVLPHPPQLDGTDSHLYFGWYHGNERDFPRAMRAWPRLARFVSEFGAQAVGENADFCEPERWPDLDWDHLSHRHSLQKARFDVYVPPGASSTFEEWRDATQQYQATVIRHHIETLRRIKYRPTGGFLQFCLADCYPSVTWSVLDHLRAPKLGYEALAEACAPVIVVADRLPDHLHPGDEVVANVHIVSDLRERLEAGEVEARLVTAHGQRSWRWTGAVEADSCARVGQVRATVPEGGRELALELELRCGDLHVTNRYTTPIVGPH